MTNPSAITHLFKASMTEEEIAAAAFLARYTGDTRTMYLADLRILFDWCAVNGINPLQASRVHLEFFARYLEEERGNGAAAVHRRLSTLKGFYRIALADDRITKDPTVFLRMPKVQYDEARTLGLSRIELGRLVATARASSPTNGALVTLMGLLGLRVSEACNVQIEDFAHEVRGHQVLRLVGKGGKPATIPLPVPVLRALRECAGDRTSGPLILRKNGTPMDRRAAYTRIKSLAKAAGLPAGVHPHTLRHASITAALDAGAPLRDAQIFARHSDPRITTRYDRGRQNLDRHAAHLVSAFISGAA
ncbi:tyrosine-type recombinase/integrase [Cryobacterium cryoconiti]|uniref:Integrase n=1 Tax=Cryobacterium cryoconiti TaxID=1259239 RepID=A0A4Y8JU65_9MICO|nr:tyrosine-type recombinase/integrase [Cryobacterium cryoconiti]TFD27537.1 integrase [Cryobacterium cryoconiti]